MKVPPFLSTKDKIFEADEYTRDLDTAFAKVRETLQNSQERQKKAADCHRRDLKLKENDWVLLRFEKARLRKKKGKERLYSKLSMRYYGPFQITERINDVSFRLRLPDTWKIHNAFHVSLLKPFRGDVPDDGEPDEQPEVEENEEILVPEQIMAHKDTKTKGRRFGIPVRGTHSHAFVSSFMGVEEITERSLFYSNGNGKCDDFIGLMQRWLSKLQATDSFRGLFSDTNHSELAAFASYALSFPTKFQALVDTFDVMRSGIPNFCAVALALNELGYKALGIRLDSGDLAYLSKQCRRVFSMIQEEFIVPGFQNLTITASNDINEETLEALNKQGHEIDAFGIGTHLVTCSSQPALGCVYKLVEINKQPRMKLSQDIEKVTIPCKKEAYRLYGVEGVALVDLLKGVDEPAPKVDERILCRHPFSESKRAFVAPTKVEKLYKCYWAGKSGISQEPLPCLEEVRKLCKAQLGAMRPDHLRALNPTPYKVSVTGKLYEFIHFLWLNEAPVGELRIDDILSHGIEIQGLNNGMAIRNRTAESEVTTEECCWNDIGKKGHGDTHFQAIITLSADVTNERTNIAWRAQLEVNFAWRARLEVKSHYYKYKGARVDGYSIQVWECRRTLSVMEKMGEKLFATIKGKQVVGMQEVALDPMTPTGSMKMAMEELFQSRQQEEPVEVESNDSDSKSY
ncbi:hypothetical protein L7F22_012198 [Adiantum nelumboides]|nr:hypothetical protein [Adiantum nelumboides]